ncbi:hypothetical protein ACN47E_008136 [Coniothyrium glycines]
MATALLGSNGPALPNELALLILDHLAADNEALCRLAQTCHSFQHLAEERIYRTIELTSVKDLDAIVKAFASRRERARAAHTLKILYQYRPEHLKDSESWRTIFNNSLKHMVNLREWHIESPYDNFEWANAGGHEWVKQDMQRFRETLDFACAQAPAEASRIAAEQRLGKTVERTVGLALLETLTIHSHGTSSDFWDLDGFHCLFRHPTLRYLHISCVALPAQEILELALHVRKTPLTTLIFDECELEPKGLLSILRTPANLRTLVLGENVFNIHHTRHVDPKLSKNVPDALDALSAVAHSLESLTHLNPSWRTDYSPHILRTIRPPGTGMRSFHNLKYLECDTSSFLHQAVIMNRDLAPPSLDTLRIRRHWTIGIDFWDQLPNIDHYIHLPSLKSLELMQSAFIWDELSHADYICEPERLRNRHAKGYQLFKAGINLKLLIEMHRDQNLIPPYLHGEKVPKIHCVYNASAIGFHRHIDNEPPAVDPNPVEAEAKLQPPTGDEPETDQLSNLDIHRLTGETRRALALLKHQFVQAYRPRRAASLFDFGDDDDDDDNHDEVDDEIDDLDEDEELELDDMEDDEDFDLEADDMQFVDEDGVHLYEHNGELYIEVYDSVTDDEDMEEDTDAQALLSHGLQNDELD